MKKIICLAVCTIIVVLMFGCAEADEGDAVQQTTEAADNTKETVKMNSAVDTIEIIPNPVPVITPSESLKEQYDIPETYTYSAQEANRKLMVEVNADIVVPDENCMPVYQARTEEFSQDIAYTLFNTFCSDTEMYHFTNQLTKEMVLEQIEMCKERMEKLLEDSEDWKQAVTSLRFFEELLPNAPEVLDEERADGTIGEIENCTDVGFNAYERYADGMNGWGKFMTVTNSGSLTYAYYSDYKIPAAEVFWDPVLTEIYYSVLMLQDTNIDQEGFSKVGLKPGEAQQMVQKLLDENGINMTAARVYMQHDKDEKNYVYKVCCVRNVNGSDVSYMTRTNYEQMAFRVNSEGVFSMGWINPLEVGEMMEHNAQLVPFSDIIKVFEEDVLYKYEMLINTTGQGVRVEIDSVTLSLQQAVTAYGSTLIPAWNFYGNCIVDGEGEYNKIGEALFTINAMNGNVIDMYAY